ncbi:hypothetical protein GCM10027341_34830 [Spirosoma knui]
MDSPDVSENADQELINYLRTDNPQAWKKIYSDNRSKVINYLRRRDTPEDLAEVIFHETLLVLDKRKQTLVLTAKLSVFLISIAIRLLKNHWRKKGKNPTQLTDDFDKLDQQALGDNEAEATELALLQLAFEDNALLGEYDRDNLLQQALEKLSEKCRRLFRMRFWEELTDQQVAVAYPMEYGRVRDQFYKCKEKLKVIFTELNKGNY